MRLLNITWSQLFMDIAPRVSSMSDLVDIDMLEIMTGTTIVHKAESVHKTIDKTETLLETANHADERTKKTPAGRSKRRGDTARRADAPRKKSKSAPSSKRAGRSR